MRPSRRAMCSGRAGTKSCSETLTSNCGKATSSFSASSGDIFPPRVTSAMSAPLAGSDAVLGESASALARSGTLMRTSPDSVPSAATAPFPSAVMMPATFARTMSCPLRMAT